MDVRPETPKDSKQPPPSSIQSPRLTFEHEKNEPQTPDQKPPLETHLSSPWNEDKRLSSPMRHHQRTPSAHREVKVTLNARVEFTNDDPDGRTHHRVNQYLILEEIGRGSYGAVHLGTDHNGNQYAIKEFSKVRLRKRAQSDLLRQVPRRGPNGLGRNLTRGVREKESRDSLFLIRHEVAIMKKLNHPNVVQLIEVLDDPEEDSLYLVMEMCKKGVVMNIGLDAPATPYSEEQCRFWFRDLILGIEYLHAQGVIHRDIKPDNLLLSEDDVLKVVDFGVSEMFEKPDSMKTAKSAGSPAFLPPELCGKHGEISGSAADIWSMGVTLFCLKFGRIPFNRDTVVGIYEAINAEQPRIPQGECSDFVDLMGRILEKDPEKRIKMPELREHPWVTKGGSDPLLSAEENCSHIIEPPNELELARAFTRKMNHLLGVMKAIRRFKLLLSRIRSSPTVSPGKFATGLEKTTTPAVEKAFELDIESLLAQRRAASTRGGSQGHAGKAPVPEVGNIEPLFLGIGIGSKDDAANDFDADAVVVADSPTAVGFNVYDRAYEEAINKGIKSGTGNQPPTMYLTKFVTEKGQFKHLPSLVEGSDTPPESKEDAETTDKQRG